MKDVLDLYLTLCCHIFFSYNMGVEINVRTTPIASYHKAIFTISWSFSRHQPHFTTIYLLESL